MPFERKVQLHLENLPTNTKLRFMELEIQAAIENLTEVFSYEKTPNITARETIAKYLAPNLRNLQDDLLASFSTLKFRKPQREEKTHYFRYKNVGSARIAKYAKVSPNFIVSVNDQYPDFNPVFPMWLGFPLLITRWDNIKGNFNLFNDSVIQEKHSYITQIGAELKEEEETDGYY